MTGPEVLLGGKTRFAVLEALVEAEQQPITAYQIAMAKGLDPAATYRCLTELSAFMIVSETKKGNQTLYKLSKGAGRAAADFLQSLIQKTPESIDLKKWISPEMQAERMAKIIKFTRIDASKFKSQESQNIDELLSKRASGELSTLIKSSKMAFDELFEKTDNTFILKERHSK
jgi:hypothetical protein